MNLPIAMIVPGGIGIEHNIPSLVQLIHRLSSSRVIYLYSFSSEKIHPLLVSENIIHTVPLTWCRRNHYASMLYFIFKLLLDYRTHKFTLLHSHWIAPAGLTGTIANIFLKLPFMITLPGGDTVNIPSIKYGGIRSPLHLFLIRWCCHRADCIVVLTDFQEAIMRSNGINPKNLRTIPYGVDISQFHFQPKQISVPLQLISVGNINPVKNIFLQLQTIASLLDRIDCRLMIVGPDLMEGELKKAAESLNIADRIEWKGKSRHSEIPSLLHSAHILLHTAQYDAEAVVVMEAFSAGTVVTGTRVGLLSDCDTEGNYTIDNSDAAMLTEKILTIARDPQLYASLQKKNRTYAEQHSIDWTASKYEMVYQELFGRDSK